MEFRLARHQDLTTENCQKILKQAEEFKRAVPLDPTPPWEILGNFIAFCEGKAKDPQVWIGLEDGELLGFVVTTAMIISKDSCCYIKHAYIHPTHRANGVMGFSLDTLAEKAKKAGYTKILCQRYGDSDAFGRMMGRFGYKYKATEFEKEV